MRINRNMSAALTNNQLKRTENKLSKTMERLSSGFKINSAGDNPSGIAISNKMKAQIEGLDQAETNSTDAISTLNIADGALNEVTSMLQRIRELAVQAANGTNSNDDRKAIQSEVDQLVKEVDRISNSTEYNTKPLLDGTSDVRVYGKHFTRVGVSDAVITGEYKAALVEEAEKADIDVGDFSEMSLTGSIRIVDADGNARTVTIDKSMTTSADGQGIVDAINSAGVSGVSASLNGNEIEISMPAGAKVALGSHTEGTLANHDGNAVLDFDSISLKGYLYINGSPMEITDNMTDEDFREKLRNTAETGYCDMVTDSTGTHIYSKEYGSLSEIEFKVSDNLGVKVDGSGSGIFSIDHPEIQHKDDKTGGYVYSVVGKDAVLSIREPMVTDSGFSDTATCSAVGNHITLSDKNGFKIDFLLDENITDTETLPYEIDMEVTDIGPMTIQLGANEYQTMEVRIPEISSKSMYLDWVDMSSEKGATRALEIMDDAITYLNDARSRIGAFENRLEYAKNSLSASQEDMTAAYSSLMDADMAEEMTTYTQQNVIDQAAISVLAQANELPDKILSLLS